MQPPVGHAGIMQEYFLKLVGSYRKFIHEDTPHLNRSSIPNSAPSPRSGHRRDNSDGARSVASSGHDDAIKGSGQVFEHNAFVNYHK